MRPPLMRPRLTRALIAIAAYTLLEALRNRLLWLLGLAMLGALGLSGFLGALALTETVALRAAVLAAVLRLAAVFLVAVFVITSMLRESNDKGRELLLALPLPRAVYLFGKLLGFGALALPPALLFGLLCLLFAPAGQCLLWAVGLLCECWIVAAFSLLCALGLSQATPALAATLAFYLLARSTGSLQLIGHGMAQSHPLAQRVMAGALDAVAALLPRLDQFTRTEWLVYHTGDAAALGALLLQTALYLALLAAAALFDLYRRNL